MKELLFLSLLESFSLYIHFEAWVCSHNGKPDSELFIWCLFAYILLPFFGPNSSSPYNT